MAKRFRFRLKVVRKLRKQAEDACRRAVAERLGAVNSVRERFDNLTEQLHEEHAYLRDEASTGEVGADRLDMDVMRRRHVYVNYLHRGIADARAELGRAQAELRRDQTRLAEASKEVKVIDKLEERQRARHLLTLARAELAEADEIGAQFARRVAGGVAGGGGG